MTIRNTVRIRLNPSLEQECILLDTLDACRTACNYISKIAWEGQEFSKEVLTDVFQEELFEHLRVPYDLTKCCVHTATAAYEVTGPRGRINFRPRDALRLLPSTAMLRKGDRVSVKTLDGREMVPWCIVHGDVSTFSGKNLSRVIRQVDGEIFVGGVADAAEVERV